MVQRTAWRRRAIGAVIVGALTAQVGLAINGYRDAHKLFAFQMFNEASTWQAEIVRVTWSGERLPIADDWAGYDWNELVHIPALRSPWRLRHASYGVAATVDFLDEALDWVATHTPLDTETRYIEATVTTFENAHAPTVTVLRSVERAAP